MSETLKTAVSELVANCQSLRSLLSTVAAEDLAKEIHLIEKRDYSSHVTVQASLEMFGGLGSVSDWVISARNGHKLNGVSSTDVNERLDHLRGKIFQILQVIHDDLKGAGPNP